MLRRAIASLALVVGILAPLGATPASAAEGDLPITTTEVDIPMRDGVKLHATVMRPKTGSWPVIIMPGTFAGDLVSLGPVAEYYASRGYIVVPYLERGFGKSTGQINAAGLKDVADASEVLTWTLANTPARPGGAGIASLSYGAGFIPTVTAKDPRFTVGAMLSGWGDMWRGLYNNGTASSFVAQAFKFLTQRNTPDPEVIAFLDSIITDKPSDKWRAFAAERSPMTYLDEMRQNPAPLYMSAAMNETIWPTEQTIDFFNAYPGVKHLDLTSGDHAAAELGTTIGTVGSTWLSALAWFDSYLAKTSDAGSSLPPVRVVPRSPDQANWTDSKRGVDLPFEAQTSTATRDSFRQYLATSPGWWPTTQKTALSSTPGVTSKKLRQGTNLLMSNGVPMFQGFFETVSGRPTTVTLPLVDQGVTGLWTGAKLEAPLSLRGSTKIHLEVTPTATQGSAFVYLLDQPPVGGANVIAWRPYSWTSATPGQRKDVDFSMSYNTYDVPKGHRLVVAVSTSDPWYESKNPSGSSLQIGSGSYLDLPLK